MALNVAHVDVARLKGRVKEKVKAKAKENVRRTPFFFSRGFWQTGTHLFRSKERLRRFWVWEVGRFLDIVTRSQARGHPKK